MFPSLPDKLLPLLVAVLRRRCPAILDKLNSPTLEPLTPDLRFKIRQAIGDEFIETGRGSDDEPNDRGLWLEEIIDWTISGEDKNEDKDARTKNVPPTLLT